MTDHAYIDAASFFDSDSTYHLEKGDLTSDGGSDYGRLLIRLCVDGYHGLNVTTDLGTTATLDALDALDYTIRHLEVLRAELAGLYRDRAPAGQCMEDSEWGRCTGNQGHDDGAHASPTEQDWQAFMAATGQPVTIRG